MFEQSSGLLQKWQVPLYLAAVALAAGFGMLWPQSSLGLVSGIDPALGLLLFATFLAIPLTKLVEAVRDVRFLFGAVVLNFALVPIVVWLLSRSVAGDTELLVGVLLVLLAPCVDYVIVFTRIAGGASHQLLAATPILMLLQMVLLPLYLAWFSSGALREGIEPEPFLRAFIWLIAIPLASALAVQLVARRFASVALVGNLMDLLMVPLMMVVLFLVVASQINAVSTEIARLTIVVPLYLAFLALMLPLGLGTARMLKLSTRAQRALVFTGGTRNSLVVLPLALAMPSHLALVPAVVVTQTIVELLGMLIYVKLVPLATGGKGAHGETVGRESTLGD